MFSISTPFEKVASQEKRSQAFESLMRRSHRQAYGLAMRLTGNPADAEDLVQESYVRAFRFFDRYDSNQPFSSWIYRIIANTHVDLVRRRGKLKTTSLDQGGADRSTAWDVADTEAGPEQLLMEDNVGEPLQAALGSMTNEFRTAVILADVEGLAYEEIAEVMNTSVGTVRSRIHRGRKQLRRHLMRFSPKAYGGVSHELL